MALTRRALGSAAGALMLLSSLAVSALPASAGTLQIGKSNITVSMRGNGHGHGMSQYGARGAAMAGLNYAQIAAFYYPGTKLRTVSPSIISVALSDAGSNLQVGASPGMQVTGVSGALPSAGVARYRLMANSAAGLRLQRRAAAGPWTTVATNLPDGAQFSAAAGHWLRLYSPDGTSTAYYGTLQAFRKSSSGSGQGVTTVNQVSLEKYTAGVTPREMPSSWQRQAVDAQAVAVRSYGRYAQDHPQSPNYDICDNTDCQVYGGAAHWDASGNILWWDDAQAANDTAGRLITYNGHVIFAQFSASDGGWTVDGGMPYLTARVDPYDDAQSGDPYLTYSETMRASTFASYFGLASVSSITVTKRDGHGAGGGRIVAGYVTGRTSSGATQRVPATGWDFQAATDAGTTWLTFGNG